MDTIKLKKGETISHAALKALRSAGYPARWGRPQTLQPITNLIREMSREAGLLPHGTKDTELRPGQELVFPSADEISNAIESARNKKQLTTSLSSDEESKGAERDGSEPETQSTGSGHNISDSDLISLYAEAQKESKAKADAGIVDDTECGLCNYSVNYPQKKRDQNPNRPTNERDPITGQPIDKKIMTVVDGNTIYFSDVASIRVFLRSFSNDKLIAALGKVHPAFADFDYTKRELALAYEQPSDATFYRDGKARIVSRNINGANRYCPVNPSSAATSLIEPLMVDGVPIFFCCVTSKRTFAKNFNATIIENLKHYHPHFKDMDSDKIRTILVDTFGESTGEFGTDSGDLSLSLNAAGQDFSISPSLDYSYSETLGSRNGDEQRLGAGVTITSPDSPLKVFAGVNYSVDEEKLAPSARLTYSDPNLLGGYLNKGFVDLTDSNFTLGVGSGPLDDPLGGRTKAHIEVSAVDTKRKGYQPMISVGGWHSRALGSDYHLGAAAELSLGTSADGENPIVRPEVMLNIAQGHTNLRFDYMPLDWDFRSNELPYAVGLNTSLPFSEPYRGRIGIEGRFDGEGNSYAGVRVDLGIGTPGPLMADTVAGNPTVTPMNEYSNLIQPKIVTPDSAPSIPPVVATEDKKAEGETPSVEYNKWCPQHWRDLKSVPGPESDRLFPVDINTHQHMKIIDPEDGLTYEGEVYFNCEMCPGQFVKLQPGEQLEALRAVGHPAFQKGRGTEVGWLSEVGDDVQHAAGVFADSVTNTAVKVYHTFADDLPSAIEDNFGCLSLPCLDFGLFDSPSKDKSE